MRCGSRRCSAAATGAHSCKPPTSASPHMFLGYVATSTVRPASPSAKMADVVTRG